MNNLTRDPLDDGISVVEYVDHMGADSSVVQAARVSYAGDVKEFERERDEKLIRYLADHDHMTPFEHTSVKLHVAAPIFVVRQWQRHRQFAYNEISRRYTSENIEFYVPNKLRIQIEAGNVQGSYGSHGSDVDMRMRMKALHFQALYLYHSMTDSGIAREQARMVLPQSLYTRMYVTGNLRSWAHFYGLRADSHAQPEIQVFARAVGEIMESLFSVSWGALTSPSKGTGGES